MDQNPIRRDGTQTAYGSPVRESELATNKVLRNTYLLLSMTLIFSAIMAAVSIALNVPSFGLLTLVGYIGLLFLTSKFQNSAAGVLCVFALTGFMGLTLGPLLSMFLEQVPNGGELVMTALGATGAVFLGMSAIALTTRKDFSFMGGFLMVGILGAFAVSLIGYFFGGLGAYQLLMSYVWVALMAGYMLFTTSAIIHGGERNYIMATVSLYVAIYNMFVNLLMIFGLSGDD
ncbi:MAG: Bax inhibitor-1/YccA family protein [Gammaproteobacteria bacterium]